MASGIGVGTIATYSGSVAGNCSAAVALQNKPNRRVFTSGIGVGTIATYSGAVDCNCCDNQCTKSANLHNYYGGTIYNGCTTFMRRTSLISGYVQKYGGRKIVGASCGR